MYPLPEFDVFDVILAKFERGAPKLVIHTLDPPHINSKYAFNWHTFQLTMLFRCIGLPKTIIITYLINKWLLT